MTREGEVGTLGSEIGKEFGVHRAGDATWSPDGRRWAFHLPCCSRTEFVAERDLTGTFGANFRR